MKFSVDQESVSDIISALTSYSDDIDSEFRKFEDEIKKIAIRTNYNKLLYALQGIIDIYNDVICGSMRKQLIAQWVEDGESLHSFAEDVYMGEESEEAVKRIENSLEEIFIGYTGNNLIDLEFSGDSNATKADFDDVVGIFESFAQEVDRIKEENSDYFEGKIEDNELYRFLIPIIESIAIGVSSFSSSAKIELDRLGDNYIERMEGAKQRVEEAKKEKASVDFDLDLFDFEDDFVTAGMLANNLGSVSNSSPEKGKTSDRASGSVSAKGNDPSKDKYEKLIQALRQFDGKTCTYPELRRKYDEHLDKYKKGLDTRVKAEYDKRDKQLKQYHKQLEQQLKNRRKELDGRYIKGTISLQQAEYLYAESCAKADQLNFIRKSTLWVEYQNICQHANQMYNGEVERCNQIANKALQNQQSICRSIYEHKQEYIGKLKSQGAEQCVEELRKIVDDIKLKCPNKCHACRLIISALELQDESNDDGFLDNIKDNIKRELSPLNKNLKGFKKQKETLSWEENLLAVNSTNCNISIDNLRNGIKINGWDDHRFTKNCQRCVIAYEVRCRGFDVGAKERLFAPNCNTDGTPKLDENGKQESYDPTGLPRLYDPNGKVNPNSWAGVVVDENGMVPQPLVPNGKTVEEKIADIENRMRQYGDGARAIVRIQRMVQRKDGSTKGTGGHVFIVEQINGKTVFCDPQTGNPDVKEHHFGHKKGIWGCLYRVCNPNCNGEVCLDCPERKKKTNSKYTYCSNCCPQVKGSDSYCLDCYLRQNKGKNVGKFIIPEKIRFLRVDNLSISNRVTECCK